MPGDKLPSDENITMLLGMGFSDVETVKKALTLAKNDVNEAVAILTGEVSKGGFDPTPDIEMSDSSIITDTTNNNVQFGPEPEKLLEISDDSIENIDISIEDIPDEFPVTNLYELEERIFTENWSIPFKKNESLAKCLYSATKLAFYEKSDIDTNCAHFVDRILPECFSKLMFSPAVRKWQPDIHEGVFNMVQLFIDFAATRLKYQPLPVKLLGILCKCFDPESEFHFKNRSRKWNRTYYEDIFGYEKCPAMSPPYTSYKDPFGWLVDLFNRFSLKGGLDALISQINNVDTLTSSILSCLWKPLGLCAPYLNKDVLSIKLSDCASNVVKFVTELKESDMKEKEVDKVFDLLRTLSVVCEALWSDKTTHVNQLHLSTLLKMLHISHFNSRMNALKELCRLIKDCESKDRGTNVLQYDVIMKWMLDNKVLSVAFSNILHQSQYCEKLKKVVEFVCTKISLEELTTIWSMQSGKHITVVDNIHNIIASAAQNFSTKQLDHLIELIQTSLKESDNDEEKANEGILIMVGKIGRDIRDEKIVIKLLGMLWDYWHTTDLPLCLLNQTVQSHLDILTDSTVIKAPVKLDYISKCVADLKSKTVVVPALRHILHNLQAMIKIHFSKNGHARLEELQSQYDLLKLITKSLVNCHIQITSSISAGMLSGDTVINNLYTHAETVITHLKLIEFLLKNGDLYLSWSHCKDIWDCLMLNEKNCAGDFETCFEWFLTCISDLTSERKKELFVSRILSTEISKVKEVGFSCFKAYFEDVNNDERKLLKNGPSILVEKQDLIGLSYLLQLILESPYQSIADEASQYFINVSYLLLAPKMKKMDIRVIHQKFICECNVKLDLLMSQLNETEQPELQDIKVTTFKKPLPVKKSILDREKILQSMVRLLNLMSLYIQTVEEKYTAQRTYPPHESCYHGSPVNINVTWETNKISFVLLSHSNERISSVRQKVVTKIKLLLEQKISAEQIQIYYNDQLLLESKDHMLLKQLLFKQPFCFSIKLGPLTSSLDTHGSLKEEVHTKKLSSLLEKEKTLPSYILAMDCKIFDKLYQLAEIEEPRMTNALQNLLSRLPTDSDILQAIDVFSTYNPWMSSPGKQAGYTKSSESVLENYFKCSAYRMSTFRVLYNLQVLSSKLMPVLDTDSASMTYSFKENWLNAGGLSLIMNILLPDTLPSNADYELRQSCYYIILQLARFLLCGDSIYEDNFVSASLAENTADSSIVRTFAETTVGNNTVSGNVRVESRSPGIATSTPIKVPSKIQIASSWPGVKNGGSPNTLNQISPSAAASSTSDNGTVRKRMRSTSVLDTVSPIVKMVIENLNEAEFTETISSLMQVAWAAGAGQLQLKAHNNSSPLITSLEGPSILKSGICLQQDSVSDMDSILCKNSLELLVMCLQLRPNFLRVFYQLPDVVDFFIDLLTGSPSEQVRSATAHHFLSLAQTSLNDLLIPSPKIFILSTLMKIQLPFWNSSGTIRGLSFKLLSQSQNYFNLLCSLFQSLSVKEQETIGVDANQLLKCELQFLSSSDCATDLLHGHLMFANTLYSCEGVDCEETDQGFIRFLLDDFLFCASHLANNKSLSTVDLLDINMSYNNVKCRKEAFNLLLTLASKRHSNLQEIATDLQLRHHNELHSSEWNFQPSVSLRPVNGFVGLKNAGATCYMNSILQLLYMQPGIKETILKLEDVCQENILYHLQLIFGHLLESQQQFYSPELFWKNFKLWGEPVNVREQQDAFEFFTNITDQLDENLNSLFKKKIFNNLFSGQFVDQKICSECSHCFECDEPFSSLPVTVKSGNLEASLEQFVRKEVMEGENAYYCEKCCEHRTTVKRTCIKSLPPVLVFQLKRFWYDWERNRAIKFDDFFSFPWILNIEPYTLEGITKKEKESAVINSNQMPPMRIVTNTKQYYELVGIVVHSGQANAGHYYSFVKNRQNGNGAFEKWYKFNDVTVERFEMNDEALKIECFGGEYRVPQTDSNSQYPENRIRTWNAYMLFYETMDKNRLPFVHSEYNSNEGSCSMIDGICPSPHHKPNFEIGSYPGSPSSCCSSNPSSPGSKDGLSLLSALIKKGERKGLFKDNMPSSIKRVVNEENIKFMQHKDVYDIEYFEFLCQLCSSSRNFDIGESHLNDTNDNVELCCLQLSVHFLFNTYLRTSKSFRNDLSLESWCTCLKLLVTTSHESCSWLIDYLSDEKGRSYMLAYLVECPDPSIREFFSTLIYMIFEYNYKELSENFNKVNYLLLQLFSFLDNELTSYIKHASQYFQLFNKYACINKLALQHLSDLKTFQRFYNFLIGHKPLHNSEKSIRKWNNVQKQEIVSLYFTIALLLLHSNNTSKHVASSVFNCPPPQSLVIFCESLQMSPDIEEYFYGKPGQRFLIEIIQTSLELPQLINTVVDILVYGCWCNMEYSLTFLSEILILLTEVPVNDLKSTFEMVKVILELGDGIQNNRVEIFIDGSTEHSICGILKLIRSCHQDDAQRAYLCMKFLVKSDNKLVRNFLLQNSIKWQWAVEWLKKKMSEFSMWSARSNTSNDNHTSFQRTNSAQNTLAEATKLLIETQSYNSSGYPNDINEDEVS
ncbi:ubiquitin carboxyl-terminal hydrolase 24 isoform X3 [Hydra vulgaris]|uniref:Ubiquitin carboxyl-terminal hydrolase 24 isoform X3 n=1 Tax=Hydra vulgaris TaxID=6087 RepID=A0ABM4C6X6_HYDVU